MSRERRNRRRTAGYNVVLQNPQRKSESKKRRQRSQKKKQKGGLKSRKKTWLEGTVFGKDDHAIVGSSRPAPLFRIFEEENDGEQRTGRAGTEEEREANQIDGKAAPIPKTREPGLLMMGEE